MASGKHRKNDLTHPPGLNYEDKMDYLAYLFAAYTLVWVVLFGYTLYLGQRERRIWERIEALREELESKISDPNKEEFNS